MATVLLDGIKKSFGSVDVIHGVSLDIAQGEFVALVGPSGCGKSTLLRMIAGLEDPTAGAISIGGTVVNDLLPKDRDIAMVFQSYALYPHMTVRENMSFALELEKRPKPDIDKAVNEASSILGLNDFLDRRPKALSGGQRQRVAMGRAIVRNPEVFLFDEPLSNLDAKLRTVMRKEVKRLHQRLKTTSIYVTHDQTEAMTMADRIVVMNAGRIEQAGTPLQLYNRPENLFVAGFIGAPQMNMLQGRVTTTEGQTVLAHADVTLGLPDDVALDEGQEVVLGIRPEHLSLDPQGVLRAVVEVVEPMGIETHVTCMLGHTELRLIAAPDTDAAPGQHIRLAYDTSAVHIFDQATGNRVASMAAI
ncbi:carbohydrate ABC transporter ATP-binding protein (CUT1 family) [Yoonia maricola]|uniref:Carbohydrate ABC transporter ATP-binding protein (CUT1 family) n=1 Tax=Yoonia maricola TaxID=420999 RepID=A0A2M8W149_9RHOB|nr:sn-glycerol-3-phosphate ABC transporter ATP-binding protein UgpC [Yoonia maricola]PJI84636.1 carbohydrate ABC transporter ATP-binding protein (CUT1 family) [Yoonia maricola]